MNCATVPHAICYVNMGKAALAARAGGYFAALRFL